MGEPELKVGELVPGLGLIKLQFFRKASSVGTSIWPVRMSRYRTFIS